MKCLSTKATSIKPSGIRKFFDLASTMEGVISLGVGEPDFATPWHICENAIPLGLMDVAFVDKHFIMESQPILILCLRACQS